MLSIRSSLTVISTAAELREMNCSKLMSCSFNLSSGWTLSDDSIGRPVAGYLDSPGSSLFPRWFPKPLPKPLGCSVLRPALVIAPRFSVDVVTQSDPTRAQEDQMYKTRSIRTISVL